MQALLDNDSTVLPSPASASPHGTPHDAHSDSATTTGTDQPMSKKLQRRLAKMQYRIEQKAARIDTAANGDDTSAFRQRKRRSQRDCNRQGALQQRSLAVATSGNSDGHGDTVASALHKQTKQHIAASTTVPDVTYINCTSRTCGSGSSECCMRVVAPYIHRYETFVKARWCGRSLSNVLSSEFAGLPADYCQRAIASGLVRINGERKDPTYTLRNGDLLVHIAHRHEPRVHLLGAASLPSSNPTSTPARWTVHAVRDDVVVINKPSSIPVHASGAYLHNSMTQLLQRECDLPELFPVHRLDRLTSGLLLFATTATKARALCDDIAAGRVQKHYVARVRGAFPLAHSTLETTNSCVDDQNDGHPFRFCGSRENAARTEITQIQHSEEDGDNTIYWRVSAPIGCVSAAKHTQGVATTGCTSKRAETLLRRLCVVGDHSVVECLPLTGRTHQIRVHLQHIGFPIANDPLYGPEDVGVAIAGSSNSSSTGSSVQLVDATEAAPTVSLVTSHATDDAIPNTRASAVVDSTTDDIAALCQAICPACRDGEHTVFSSVHRDRYTLWLHSFKYSSSAASSWSFEVPLPPWATIDDRCKRSCVAGGVEEK